ncbi:MAG: nucleotidyl transferase AbiEii/AbiGii toxin family protein [Akkermansia sp.]
MANAQRERPPDRNNSPRHKKRCKPLIKRIPPIFHPIHTLCHSSQVPLKIDITVGDAITPREITHRFKLLLEDRYIPIPAYNIETILAEKLETIFSRSTLNTRPRDFYDVYILSRLRGEEINKKHLQQALQSTASKRHSLDALNHYLVIIESIEQSQTMQHHWANYQKDFSYASASVNFLL